MHPNPVYRRAEAARNLAFARARGFGVLSVNGVSGPLMAHIPFVPDKDGGAVELHLVRSNPIIAALSDPLPAVIAVQGPDSYISPDWYGVPDQVPTWNYVAVHLRGRLERLPQGDLPGLLDRLSARFEARLLPKPPWTAAKMSDGVADRMMRMIVPCRLHIGQIDGTWKLSQNKDDAVRMAAADGVEEHGIGSELAALAAFMRDDPR